MASSRYARQVELAELAGFDSVREYSEARHFWIEDGALEGLRGEALAMGVAILEDPESASDADLQAFIELALEYDPEFDVEGFLDEVYQET